MNATTFFDDLAGRHDPLLEHWRGSIRFEVTDDRQNESWLVAMDHGDVQVSRDEGVAACTVRATRPVLDAVLAGEMNLMAAVLRNALVVDGDPELLVRFRRLLALGAQGPAQHHGAGEGDGR